MNFSTVVSGKLGFVSLQFDFICLFRILQHSHWFSGRSWGTWRRKKTMIWLKVFSQIPQNHRSLWNQKPQCSLNRAASPTDCIQNRTYPIYLRLVHQSRPLWGCGVHYATLIWRLFILQSIQAVLSGLTMKDLFSFKMCLLNSKKDKTLQQATEGDILDFVDKMLEVFGSNPFSFHNKYITLNERVNLYWTEGWANFWKWLCAGQDNSLLYTINTLQNIKKETEAEELRNRCKRGGLKLNLSDYRLLPTKHQTLLPIQPCTDLSLLEFLDFFLNMQFDYLPELLFEIYHSLFFPGNFSIKTNYKMFYNNNQDANMCWLYWVLLTTTACSFSFVLFPINSIDTFSFEATADLKTSSHPRGRPSTWEAELSQYHLCCPSNLGSGLQGGGPVAWAPNPSPVALPGLWWEQLCWSEQSVPTKEKRRPTGEDSGHHRNSRNWHDGFCGKILSGLGRTVC